MSWKDILKIKTKDVRADARRFAPEAVAEGEEQFRQEGIEGLDELGKELLEHLTNEGPIAVNKEFPSSKIYSESSLTFNMPQSTDEEYPFPNHEKNHQKKEEIAAKLKEMAKKKIIKVTHRQWEQYGNWVWYAHAIYHIDSLSDEEAKKKVRLEQKREQAVKDKAESLKPMHQKQIERERAKRLRAKQLNVKREPQLTHLLPTDEE